MEKTGAENNKNGNGRTKGKDSIGDENNRDNKSSSFNDFDDKQLPNNDLHDGISNGQGGSENTLSRGNPITEFLRHQKGNLKDLTQEEFLARYESFMKESEMKKSETKESNDRKKSDRDLINGDHKGSNDTADEKTRNTAYGEGNYKNIVLKFTTLSDGCYETPSFTVDRRGAKIGRNASNDISVPSDQRLAPEAHSSIEYSKGSFYLIDGGYSFSASVRIGIGNSHNKKYFMDKDARFSAGNSVFQSRGINADGNLEIYAMEGPLKGEILRIRKSGATFGRSSENTISVPDRELSRRHSKVEYDDKLNRYVVHDMGSTNGTYIQLVGPYGGRFKLSLNDHILVGRTGFSINRYDYGLSEEMGYRQAMEDACSIVQHLNISPLCIQDLSPQSFFGVFDGHGGIQASHYLSQHLHVNVAHGLLGVAHDIFAILEDVAPNSLFDNAKAVERLDKIVEQALKTTFLSTDQNFISTSTNPQHGSTATTALILGKRLYCANVGDSRTLLCRNFQPMLLSQDHKPNREDESKRIRDAGGFVINSRVMGELAVSRAFGDVDFKKGIQSIIEEEGGSMPSKGDGNDGNGESNNWDQPLIIAEPDIQATNVSEGDQFLLLACDGLFDVYTPEEIVTFVKEDMEKHGDTQRCCQNLTYDAIRKRNSRDNVSVILIILNKWY
eukprot:gene6901-9453_t